MAYIEILIGAMVASTAHAVEIVTFVPGTYYLAADDFDTAVDTLVVSVSAGTAKFTLTGIDNATFTAPNNSSPMGGGVDPYYSISGSSLTASWDTGAYPYLTFWSTGDGGGATAGSIPGADGSNYFDIYQSTLGTGQVFTATGAPEPAAWTLMLMGFGGLGAVLRAARKRPATASTDAAPGPIPAWPLAKDARRHS
jgi:hypothetical protein